MIRTHLLRLFPWPQAIAQFISQIPLSDIAHGGKPPTLNGSCRRPPSFYQLKRLGRRPFNAITYTLSCHILSSQQKHYLPIRDTVQKESCCVHPCGSPRRQDLVLPLAAPPISAAGSVRVDVGEKAEASVGRPLFAGLGLATSPEPRTMFC